VEVNQVIQANSIGSEDRELYAPEVLAKTLAAQYRVSDQPAGGLLLLKRLEHQETVLSNAYQHFASTVKESLSYAAEWILDNYYVVQQAIRQIREDMPKGYYQQLPKLVTPPLVEYPRIYGLAWEMTAHYQGQLNGDQVIAFIQTFQTLTALTMGELWALPTMLRLSSLEYLCAALIRLTKVPHYDVALPASTPQTLTDDVVVGHCITTLRMLATQKWKAIFEQLSLVEQTLRRDPAKVYPLMDFDTRNRYRGVVESLARAARRNELEVAEQVVALSEEAQRSNLASHIGFYLVDKGRSHLEASLNYRPPWRVNLGRWYLANPTLVYIGSVSLLTVFVSLLLVAYAAASGGSLWQVLAAGLLTMLPASAIAVSVVNWIITSSIPPRLLPRMDFEKGIPAEHKTIVVIPALLTSNEEVDALLQQIELHYLRNTDPNLAYALLTDFADAPTQQTPEDEPLVTRASACILALNEKYKRQPAPFYLFHRERRWNPVEGVWLGWERKRGKLAEFNRLLRGFPTTSYTIQIGDLSVLPDIKYVVTLDADTILPQGSARRLVATLAHPLNQPIYNDAKGKVTAGYSILQPRVEIKPTSANQSLFMQIYAGDRGLDLYTLAVSDVYQDFFGEGIYVGKGLYQVDSFERSLSGRIPEDTLLSHDLFESIHARAALVTDVVLLEDYPPHYVAHIRRLHRWVRGDWQLLPWLFPFVPNPPGGRPIPNYLTVFDRWKIIDNLRRSLVTPALLVLMIAGWLYLSGSPIVWTGFAALTPAVALITGIVDGLMRHRPGAKRAGIDQIVRPLRLDVLRWLLALVFLCYEASVMVDAIITTLIRGFITRRHLLQWTAAAHTVRLFGADSRPELTLRQMVIVLPIVVLLTGAVVLIHPTALIAAAPVLTLWLVSPQVAYWISLPVARRDDPLTAEQKEELHRVARRTWLYFEQFVGPEDHWLPPDHFQESPRGVVAHRTSPTNIGLLLLSTLSAYDLGYTGMLDLVVRLRATFETLDKLEHHRGHLLNWYDTQTLEPLPPSYVSTVDSGNLAACLLVVKQACLALRDVSVMRSQRWKGLLDTLALLKEGLDNFAQNIPNTEIAPLLAHLTTIQQRVQTAQSAPETWGATLTWLSGPAWTTLSQHIVTLIESGVTAPESSLLTDLRMVAERTHHHLIAMQRDMNLLLPWMLALNQPPELFVQPSQDSTLMAAWQAFTASIPMFAPRLEEIGTVCEGIRESLRQLQDHLKNAHGSDDQVQAAQAWCARLAGDLQSTPMRIHALRVGLQDLAAQADTHFEAMDFSFLFDNQRQVFHIGYNVSAGRLDDNYYDLLASEARIASLLSIAKGDVPRSHWLHMARPITQMGNDRVLLSWSGTMFEYLMPCLVTETYDHTILTQSCRSAVAHQIAYGLEKNVPWGMSESGYYAFDGNMNYQYRAFGVPGLGFKRGLAEDLVITPYASLLALAFRPQSVMQNITNLRKIHMMGRYGFYEAVDFTRSRLPLRQNFAIVQSYMAHHQAMIMVSVANYLLENLTIRRLHAEPRVQSVELLLQERIPDQAPLEYPHLNEATARRPTGAHVTFAPWRVPVDTPLPHVHVLSNGTYSVLITNAGSGYSAWQNLALSRWRPDTTLDGWGTWIYIQDCDNGAFWSACYQPTGVTPDDQTVLFYPHQVEFHRRNHDISLSTEITVAADDDVEIRRIHLTNHGHTQRHLTLTSYGEVMLSPQAERHSAFNKLFIESEYLPEINALLFRRRPRSANEEPLFLLHMLVVEPGQPLTRNYEADRARFVGRYRTPRSPAIAQVELSKTVGATLDPIMSLSQDVMLEAHDTTYLALITLAARSRASALALAQRYQSWAAIANGFDSARRQTELALRQLELDTSLEYVQQLLSAILYPNPALRSAPEVLRKNRKGQSGLWAYSVSGDYPILLVRVGDVTETPLVRELLRAHTYWRSHQLMIDLVILNTRDSGYSQELHEQLHRLVARTNSSGWLNRRGGIFVLSADQMSEEDRVLFYTVARVVLDGDKGSLSQQLGKLAEQPVPLPLFAPAHFNPQEEPTPPLLRPDNLRFDNGLGGFSPDGKEYVIYLEPGTTTPVPWVNIVANAGFGFLVSEAGAGYTWAENSGENRLTPWRNDPVIDAPGEALYLRDEESARVWSPTLLPAGDEHPYLIRHGAGYSIFEHHSRGLKQQLELFVVPDAPVKVIKLRLENTWSHTRRITATYYAEWVLGTARNTSQPYVVSEFDHPSGALLARNAYNSEFGERVAFLAGSKAPHGLTADRREFLGRMGSYRRPAALERIGLASNVRAGLDPCAAIQLHIDLPPGEAEEVYFLLGQGANRAETLRLIQRYQDAANIEAALQSVRTLWDDLLGVVEVQTPDAAMNLMLNRWLLYQALACRVWGRSAFYQSSGAFGYRDQLQDVMGLIHTRPDLAREHILRAARHQFEEGDVLHWWHPPSGRGVRTRFSDDLLWLPFVTAYYVDSTGDANILREEAPFLRSEPLKPDEDERYGYYETTQETYTLYDHCLRAIKRGSTAGAHGLPLMGTGDWNDGMNRVGVAGRGESVWVGWFLFAVLDTFIPLCALMGDAQQAAVYRQQSQHLQAQLEAEAWDGNWYRRAYYDDGTPLGSAQNRECQIDSIPQSWAVISGAGSPSRAQQAMDSVAEHLVRHKDKLVLLLAPPFDKTPRDPGYIKGYLPGIRENGGQYTHAAIWAAWAYARLGQGDRALELFTLLNPVMHGNTPEGVARYKVEPYVIAADVYSVAPHTGRGGWTWYTGSASWMYRLGIEAILGLRRKGSELHFDPCIPSHWLEYELVYRDGTTTYAIHVRNPEGVNRGVQRIEQDGTVLPDKRVHLQKDGRYHTVIVWLGKLAAGKKSQR
jgi:cyclic beta-1,2-glucan synthetase